MSVVKKTTADELELEFEGLDLGTDSDSEEDEIEALKDDDSTTLTLISGGVEPVSFELRKKAALLSNLVDAILVGDPTTTDIPLRRVDSNSLALVVEYLEYHCGKKQPAEIAKPIRSVRIEKIVEDLWDAEFMNKRTTMELMVLANASNYIDCHSLKHLVAAKIVTILKGKSKEQIHHMFREEMTDKIPEPLIHCTPKPTPPPIKRKADIEAVTERMDDSSLLGAGDEPVADGSELSHRALIGLAPIEEVSEECVIED